MKSKKDVSRFLKGSIFAAVFALGSLSAIGTNSAAASQAQAKEWTFLVYLNADNNLNDFGYLNFAEMERVGSTDNVNVVVQFDPIYRGKPTTRYYVTRNPDARPGKISSVVLEELGETNSGDWKDFAGFLNWGIQRFPAKKYAVVVWNHGAGWEGISYDDNPRSFMTMPELRQGLEVANQAIARQRGVARRAGQGMIDLLNFDACLMSTLEVAYELRNQVRVMVGSQFNEPGEGENYTAILGPLAAKPSMTAAEFSQVLVYQYALRYAGQREISYLSVDLTKIPMFTHAFNLTAAEMLNASSKTKSGLMKVFRNPIGGGFDLIAAMERSLELAKSESDERLSTYLSALIQMYGYPNDLSPTVQGDQGGLPGQGPVGKAFRVVRAEPGAVHYRNGASANWKTIQLQRTREGQYVAQIPKARGLQYFVIQGSRRQTREALNTFLRDGSDPIVYHSNFPESSPVIADAHSFLTKGAHGISLYSLAGFQALGFGHAALGGNIHNQYRRLEFARIGAPNWTRFFGIQPTMPSQGQDGPKPDPFPTNPDELELMNEPLAAGF